VAATDWRSINKPRRWNGQTLQGLISCAEWTGVKLSPLLDEAGVEPRAQWLLAEGADAATMSRSIPMAKSMKDAMTALYQNGERLRPSNGYPVRLQWPRRIKVTEGPTITRDETSHYTILLQTAKHGSSIFPRRQIGHYSAIAGAHDEGSRFP
jgi:sulfane dehydrogenase subunit SoxC